MLKKELRRRKDSIKIHPKTVCPQAIQIQNDRTAETILGPFDYLTASSRILGQSVARREDAKSCGS
jgi:hypothetical protein